MAFEVARWCTSKILSASKEMGRAPLATCGYFWTDVLLVTENWNNILEGR